MNLMEIRTLERYNFTWMGKQDAILEADRPTNLKLVTAPDESVNFNSTDNLFIEGDNLDALKLLQAEYAGKIKMIYIDPPYNTGNKYVYNDKFTANTGSYADRRHSNWLSMMYPRLVLARKLLREDGVIFISIDDNEVHHLRMLMNEIFGEGNFRAQIAWQKKYSVSNNNKKIAPLSEFIFVYACSDTFRNGLVPRTIKADARYSNPDNDPRGVWKSVSYRNMASPDERPNLVYSITNPNTGAIISPDRKAWKNSYEVYEQHIKDDMLYWGKDGKSTSPRLKLFLKDVKNGMIPHTWWPYTEAGHTHEAKDELHALFGNIVPYDTPKPTRLLKRICQVANVKDDDIILDFFAGSCSTAHAVLNFNQERNTNLRFIMVQSSEPTDNSEYPTIAEIGKERIRRVIAQIHLTDATPRNLGFKVYKIQP